MTVDRPTQLICIWNFICCQQTNTKDITGRMTDTSTVTDFSLNHEFLGSLQGSDGEHQLSEEQVDDS